jgi:NTE family protein
LPLPVRTLLSGIGATEARGASLASYLLFESSFTRELIALGIHDTMQKKSEVTRFFRQPPGAGATAEIDQRAAWQAV